METYCKKKIRDVRDESRGEERARKVRRGEERIQRRISERMMIRKTI